MTIKKWSQPVRLFALIFIICVIGVFLWYFKEIITPVVYGAVIAYILNPLHRLLHQKSKLKHRTSGILVFVLFIVLVVSIPALITPWLINQIQVLLAGIQDFSANYYAFIGSSFTILNYTFTVGQFFPEIPTASIDLLSPVAGGAFAIIEVITKNFVSIMVILVTTYYLLLDWPKMRYWLFKFPPVEYRKDIERIYEDVIKVWANYLRSQVLFMVAVAILDSIVWLAIGLPGAVLLGVITGAFSLVPEIGAFVAGLMSVIVALIEGSNFIPITNLWFAVLVLILYFILTNVKNIWLRPIIIGRSVRFHEGIVFIVVIAALIYHGALAAFLVVPILVSTLVLGRYLRARVYGYDPFPEESGVDESTIETPEVQTEN